MDPRPSKQTISYESPHRGFVPVAVHFFRTRPARHFPVPELHGGIPLLHYLTSRASRAATGIFS